MSASAFLAWPSRPAPLRARAVSCRRRGEFEPKPDLAALVAAAAQGRLGGLSLAA